MGDEIVGVHQLAWCDEAHRRDSHDDRTGQGVPTSGSESEGTCGLTIWTSLLLFALSFLCKVEPLPTPQRN